MKIVFFYMGAENLGIEYLSAAARRTGHEVDLLYDPAVFNGHFMWDIPALSRILDLRNQMIKRIKKNPPAVAAFSCVSANYQWALSIARAIRTAAPSTTIVFGGSHISAASHSVIGEDCVDALITGEADIEFPKLLNIIETGAGTPGSGVMIKKNGEILSGTGTAFIENLDILPWPDKQLFFQKVPAMEEHYVIMTSRGCPFSCAYCYTKMGEKGPGGKKLGVRRRTIENVMAEFEDRMTQLTRRVVFRDDVFTSDCDWLAAFSDEYSRKVRRPYYCYSHPAMMNREIADMLKISGCCLCTMGVQSVDEGLRKNILNRRYTNEQVRESVSLLKERGISVSLDHIMGIPGDTLEILEKAAIFYSELKPDRMFAFWLTYYPGTKMIRIAREMGLINDDDVKNANKGQVGYRFSGGGTKNVHLTFRKLASLITATPLLPRSLVSFIVQKKLYRFIPPQYGLTNILILLNALRTRDMFFLYAVRTTLFSRKNVP